MSVGSIGAPRTGTTPSWRDWPAVSRIVVVVIVAWLAYPMLTPVHVEGFSASIESLALHLATGSFGDYDRLHPANLEFFALTRLGNIVFVAGLIRWLGISSEWAMRATMWIGFATLIYASVVLVRRWTDAPVAGVVAVLALIPGITESAFFYNDNVLSAALAIAALAILGSSTRISTTAIAGLFFGSGTIARLDAVLLAPAVALIAYEQHPRLDGDFARRAVVFTTTALLPVVVVPAAFDASILDVVRISNYGVVLWQLAPSLAPHAREFAYFVGMPAALLMAFGILRLVRSRAVYRMALLVGVPLFFNLVGLGKILRARQLLPMTPFFAALVILGVRYLSDDTEGSRLRLRLAVVIVGVAILFGPVARLQISDGPRVPYGRFWSPPLWTRWQGAVRANMADLAQLVDHSGRAATTAILTDSWDADRYLHLELQREGFTVEDINDVQPRCAKAGELFRRGSSHLLHLRLHQPFLPSPTSLAAMRLDRLALPCLWTVKPEETYLLSPGAQLIPRVRAWPALGDRVNTQSLIDSFFATGYDPLIAIRLAPPDMVPLAKSFALDAADRRASPSETDSDLARAERLMSNQVWPAGGPP
jgi:hypothetical protein